MIFKYFWKPFKGNIPFLQGIDLGDKKIFVKTVKEKTLKKKLESIKVKTIFF